MKIKQKGKYGEKNTNKAIEYYEKAASLGDKLAIELLAAKGKTHLQSTFMEEKDFLKKSQMGKFCDDNLMASGKHDIIESTMLPAVKKGKDLKSTPYMSGVVTSGLPKEFVQKSNFNPQEFDFYKREEHMFHDSDRNHMDYEYENQKLIEEQSHRGKHKTPQYV